MDEMTVPPKPAPKAGTAAVARARRKSLGLHQEHHRHHRPYQGRGPDTLERCLGKAKRAYDKRPKG
jgi:hypothetical protein